ncbi:MAG: SIS domain-containing protein, partial [Bacteroidota bacterium]|nr:SIS domain-containing protein [Bacteroidota bacterium]MDX5431464.1 SIS domain-containing protein [Bacteroidota bacterium]MDX5470191.1 SIS domain-containing protein [Bacteroidota bacterium]
MITHHSSLEVFYEQLEYVQKHYSAHGLKAEQFNHLVAGGLGGSGIGATIAKSLFSNRMPIPVEVINDYSLPHYVNERSLVILGSYSGNTEETLSLLEQALDRKATIVIVTAGGQLMDKAKSLGLPYYTIETGFQPRMALGYSLGFMLKIFGELLGDDLNEEFETSINALKDKQR